MFMSFLIVISINSGIIVVLDSAKVFLNNEIFPNLYNLLVEIFSFLDLSFLLEDFAHIVIAAA